LGANAVTITTEEPYTFNLAGRSDYIQSHLEAVAAVLAALVDAQRYATEAPAAAKSLVIQSSEMGQVEFDAAWQQYDLRVTLDQSLISLLEDEARWALKGNPEKYRQMPNFLTSIVTEPLATVQPGAVTILR
jgi:NitT/TauT family transport system substrate-binding protein